MIVYDAAGVKTAISPDGSGSVYDAQGRRISASSTTAQLYSFDNAPANPSAYDDEFQTGSLASKWTMTSTGTTNPVAAGTVNPTSSLTTPILDLSTMPSWLLFQSDNSTVKEFGIYQTISLDTNATIFCKLKVTNSVLSATDEGDCYLKLWNSSDSNESVTIGEIQQVGGGGYAHQITVQNNGAFTSVIGAAIAEKRAIPHIYVLLWKVADVYHAMFGMGDGPLFYLGSVSKTGVTTFDRVTLGMLTANETPSIMGGMDFFRYYGSNTYALMNPTV